ncbi:MAG TPA: hypothetical protein VHD31_02490 [Candidatus Paceibacterota bacterium]|nr:hypothetical protein [Candidatus Paceibacterota bacterium]
MPERKVQQWSCKKCGKTGHVSFETTADVMSVVDLIARDHKRASPVCKQPVRRIQVLPNRGGGMKVIGNPPSGSFPTLMLIHGVVHLRISGHNPPWRLKQGEYIRFNKHGKFLVTDANKNVAFLEVTIPRKGWNPEGTRQCIVALPQRCQITVIRGQLHLRRIPLKEWRSFEKSSKPSHPQFSRAGEGPHMPMRPAIYKVHM